MIKHFCDRCKKETPEENLFTLSLKENDCFIKRVDRIFGDSSILYDCSLELCEKCANDLIKNFINGEIDDDNRTTQ